MDRATDEQLAGARRVLQVDYNQDVADWVTEVRRMVADGEHDDPSDAIHDLVDGLRRVIYTGEAIEVLRYCASGSESAAIEDCGADVLINDGTINWEALAFAAISRDIHDRIQDLR